MTKRPQPSPIKLALRRAWLARSEKAEGRKPTLAKQKQPTPGRITSTTVKPNFNPYADAMRQGGRPDMADAVEALDQLYADARARGWSINRR